MGLVDPNFVGELFGLLEHGEVLSGTRSPALRIVKPIRLIAVIADTHMPTEPDRLAFEHVWL